MRARTYADYASCRTCGKHWRASDHKRPLREHQRIIGAANRHAEGKAHRVVVVLTRVYHGLKK